MATVISGKDAQERPDSVGPPVPVVDLAIVDPDGNEVPEGQTGEVLIQGPIIMPGYWNKPEATAETVIDGWLHTGDIGYLDEDGFLFITDRAKDMIIRGGENIYCVEIEQRLVEHPGVADAAVIGVPHDELGEEVKAVIQVMPDGVAHRAGREGMGGRGAGQLQGPRLRRADRRQAPPQRQRQAPQERPPRRGRGLLLGDDVARVSRP